MKSETTDEEILEMYRFGLSVNEIGTKCRCSPLRPMRIAREAGILRPRGWSASRLKAARADIEVVVSMYSQGMSVREIGTKLGRSHQYAYRRLIAAGVKIRPSHGHEFHKQWKGGRIEAGQGYWKQMIDAKDPMASMRDHHGYVKEHRLVLARKLGRPLLRSETVHHIDGDKANNEPANLELRQGKHGKHVVMCCLDCGSRNIGHARLGDKPA